MGGAGTADTEVCPFWKGGRRGSVDGKAALSGILYVLQTVFLEKSCRKNWLWQRNEMLASIARLEGRRCLGEIISGAAAKAAQARPDRWSRASIDATSVPSPPGDQETGPNPIDRGKLGSKRHVVVDARDAPFGDYGHGSESTRLGGV